MESTVRASVFVDNLGIVPQREQCGNRGAVFSRNPDVQRVAHALGQILKPTDRLRRQVMSPPGDHQQMIKSIDELGAAARLVRKLFLLGALDFSLDGILVQILKKLLKAWPEIELMKIEGFGSLEFISRTGERIYRADFQVLTMLPSAFLDQAIR